MMQLDCGPNVMLSCNKLRIDSGHGSPVVEYRIENGQVESRILEPCLSSEVGWQPLTAEQISSHIMANTVVAHWLRRRMGLHSLLRACSATSHANQLTAGVSTPNMSI